MTTLPLPPMDPRVSALRWLLNITTEYDRKDVRTRQAARLLDDFNVDGRTNRALLEDLWSALSEPEPGQALDDWGNPIVYDTREVDSVTHSLTGDEGEEDSLTVLNGLARYVENVWPGKSALEVLQEYEQALTDLNTEG
jgi:hypothetical protein